MEILTAVAGAFSIYLGYRLFCDCAYQKSRIRHLVSGALLAVFGLGILIADVHALLIRGASFAFRLAEKGNRRRIVRTSEAQQEQEHSAEPRGDAHGVGPK